MTIHTDTFPLVVQYAANNPSLFLYRANIEGKQRIMLGLLEEPSIDKEPIRVDITSLIRKPEALYSKLQEPLKVNLIDNSTFKHILERLATRDSVLL